MDDLQQWLGTDLRRRLDRLTRRRAPRLPAPQVLVQAPGARFTYGDADRPFHTASIGKNFLAVLIGRLVEAGRLSLTAPLDEVLRADCDIPELSAASGVNPGSEITVEHLLEHRSGLPDPFLPPRGHPSACSLTAIAADPSRAWTPRDVLTAAARLPARGCPGERFHYSDAGYALLSLVAERVGGAPVAELLRCEVFELADMPHTRQVPVGSSAGPIAPMWLAGTEVSRTPALSIGSIDGGAVTTAEDLVAFHRALCSGRLLSAGLLRHLTRPRSRLRPGIHYGAGFVTLRFGGFLPLVLRGLPEPVGGLGLTATHSFYYPEQDAHVILNFHSTKAMSASFQTHIAIARRLAQFPQGRSPAVMQPW